MWPNDVARPSAQLRDLLTGKIAWGDAPAAIRSMAQLPIHQAALTIIAAPEKGTRRNMLGKIPAAVRPHVEAEIKRLWAMGKRQ